MDFKEFIGAIATFSTVLQFFSGFPTVRKVQLQGTPGDISHVPFLAGLFGCLSWFSYGIVIGDNSVYYTNIVGIILNFLYVAIFFYYSPVKNQYMKQVFASIVFFFCFFRYINILTSSSAPEDKENGKSYLGMECTIITIFCILSPLISLKHVIKTRSTESLPFPLILAMFLVCAQWSIYAILINDFFMQITNIFGTLIAACQLALFLIYPSSGRKPTASTENLIKSFT